MTPEKLNSQGHHLRARLYQLPGGRRAWWKAKIRRRARILWRKLIRCLSIFGER